MPNNLNWSADYPLSAFNEQYLRGLQKLSYYSTIVDPDIDIHLQRPNAATYHPVCSPVLC